MNQQGSSDSDSGILQLDNGFWHFSLAVYAQADVAKECLELQRTIGLDINLLLFSAWIGTRTIVLSGKDIEDASRRVADWQKLVVRPLRSVRRELNSFERVELESFRARVKTIELEAEQIEQAILFAYAKRFKSFHTNARDAVTVNVKKYVEIITGSRSSDRSAPLLIGAALRLCS